LVSNNSDDISIKSINQHLNNTDTQSYVLDTFDHVHNNDNYLVQNINMDKSDQDNNNSSFEADYFEDSYLNSSASDVSSTSPSSFEENDEDYSEFLKEKIENPFIYNGSNVKLKEFCISFLLITKGDRLSRKTTSKILQFISSILPEGNHIPLNYDQFLKSIKPDENIIRKACKICSMPSTSEICDSLTCQRDKNKKSIIKKFIQNYNQPVAIAFDFKSQLKNIILKEYDNIINYKSKKAYISY
jgi:hypothetical protein